MDKTKVEISNPLLIMKLQFMEAQLKEKHSKAAIEVKEHNRIPLKVIITFPKESDASSFISHFNGKPIDKSIK